MLTRKQQKAIQSALYHAQRASAYIMSQDVAVARRCDMATTSLHYVSPSGQALHEVDKDIGSDLCGLVDCIKELRLMLEPPVIEHGDSPR